MIEVVALAEDSARFLVTEGGDNSGTACLG